MSNNHEEKQERKRGPFDLSALLEALQAGEVDVLAAMEQVNAELQLGNAFDPSLFGQFFSVSTQAVRHTSTQLSFRSGGHYCSVLELLDNEWVRPSENDFTTLSRNWCIYEPSITDVHVRDIYSTTRREALDPSTTVSKSPNRMLVDDLTPVRLCSTSEASNVAGKAHLCPKNGKDKKAYTWIYVAAAALGMPLTTKDDREALCKAVCGSVSQGNTNVTGKTGLNRSPFNLLSFLDQEVWFDNNPGVIVLPVMDEHEARDWSGGPYEVVIMCNDIPTKASADFIAMRIGLTSTEMTLLQDASAEDMVKSVSLLSQVVKASVYCLENKAGPDGGRGAALWEKYREKLATSRKQYSVVMTPRPQDGLDGKVPIPILKAQRPAGKMAAKVDLALMIPPVPATAVYPDPLLLAYKSSVNWTRIFGFKLMAEAEPSELVPGGEFPPADLLIASSDQASKISAYSSLY
jgi:hypothetical protein